MGHPRLSTNLVRVALPPGRYDATLSHTTCAERGAAEPDCATVEVTRQSNSTTSASVVSLDMPLRYIDPVLLEKPASDVITFDASTRVVTFDLGASVFRLHVPSRKHARMAFDERDIRYVSTGGMDGVR